MPSSNQLAFEFSAVPIFVALGRDAALEATARQILQSLGAAELAMSVRVEWNARLQSAAGRADSRRGLISLNPRLQAHGADEIDRTLRHELAHLLAQFRAGRERITPHGNEWRRACSDLGIADEVRCHTLPFPVQKRAARFVYRCPQCRTDYPRTRRIKRAVACLPCCRRYYGGKFDKKAQLRLVRQSSLA